MKNGHRCLVFVLHTNECNSPLPHSHTENTLIHSVGSSSLLSANASCLAIKSLILWSVKLMHIRAIVKERKKQKDRDMSDLELSSPTLIPKCQNLMVINTTYIDRHAFICPLVFCCFVFLSFSFFFFFFYLIRSPALVKICVFNTDVTLHERRTIRLPSTGYITKGRFILKSIK